MHSHFLFPLDIFFLNNKLVILQKGAGRFAGNVFLGVLPGLSAVMLFFNSNKTIKSNK